MTKHKLDQLFKDKLEHSEMVPSEVAFQKFQSKISGSKKSMVWLYIAASLSLILSFSTWFWVNTTEESVEIATINSPTNEVTSELNESEVDLTNSTTNLNSVEETDVSEVSETIVADIVEARDNMRTKIPKETIPAEADMPLTEPEELIAQDVIEKVDVQEVEMPDLILESENATIVAESEVQDLTTDVIEKSLPKVKITYISGRKKKSLVAESKVTLDSTNVKDGTFNRILNSARSLANGSLIADLRDAKENFFNKNDD